MGNVAQIRVPKNYLQHQEILYLTLSSGDVFWVLKEIGCMLVQAMTSQKLTLLGLPDVLLEKIGKTLSPDDLSGTMQTCTTLHTLLRPRQTAMVCLGLVYPHTH